MTFVSIQHLCQSYWLSCVFSMLAPRIRSGFSATAWTGAANWDSESWFSSLQPGTFARYRVRGLRDDDRCGDVCRQRGGGRALDDRWPRADIWHQCLRCVSGPPGTAAGVWFKRIAGRQSIHLRPRSQRCNLIYVKARGPPSAIVNASSRAGHPPPVRHPTPADVPLSRGYQFWRGLNFARSVLGNSRSGGSRSSVAIRRPG